MAQRVWTVLENDQETFAATDEAQKASSAVQKTDDELLAMGTERKADPDLPLSPWSDPEQYVLMVKHLLREAALKGYDKLSWTPGWMQARRWGKAITNVVQGVQWQTEGNQRRVNLLMFGGGSAMNVNVDAETGNILSINADMSAEGVGGPLSRLIGGPVARQVLEAESGQVDGQRITFGTSGYHDRLRWARQAHRGEAGAQVWRRGGRGQNADRYAREACQHA